MIVTVLVTREQHEDIVDKSFFLIFRSSLVHSLPSCPALSCTFTLLCICSSDRTFHRPFIQVQTVREKFSERTTHSVTLVSKIILSVVVTKQRCRRSLTLLSVSCNSSTLSLTHTHTHTHTITHSGRSLR